MISGELEFALIRLVLKVLKEKFGGNPLQPLAVNNFDKKFYHKYLREP